jgi:hypothetical protein
MAQFQRNALYDMADHHRLRNAIINELERKHKAAKGINYTYNLCTNFTYLT